MGKKGFDISKDFEVTSYDGLHVCKNRVMCDYLAKVQVRQGSTIYFAEVGYVGRDISQTKPKYLFIEKSVYNLDTVPGLFDFNFNNEFTQWLMF